MKRLLLLFVFFTTSFSSSAFTQDGNKLLFGCSQVVKYLDGVKKSLDSDASYCMGLLKGFMHATTIGHGIYSNDRPNYKVEGSKDKRGICLPQSVTISQSSRIIVKWLKDHPNKLHEDETILIFLALYQSFPCNK